MASSSQRPTNVSLVLGLMGVAALYGLYLANELRPLITYGLIPGGVGTLLTLAVAVIVIASLGMLWSMWQTMEGQRASAYAWANRSTIGWTVAMVSLAVAPFMLGSATRSAAIEGAAAAQSGDPAAALAGLGAALFGGFFDQALFSILRREALIRAGIPALVGAFAVYQLNTNFEIKEWFMSGGTKGGPEEPAEVRIVYKTPPPEAKTLPPLSAGSVAQLVRLRRGQPEGLFEITATGRSSKIVIGRDSRQTQITIGDDPTVSRTHAAFIVDDNRVYIEDLASQWGVEVNGTKILKRQLLFHDDRIQLGDSQFVFMQAGQGS